MLSVSLYMSHLIRQMLSSCFECYYFVQLDQLLFNVKKTYSINKIQDNSTAVVFL